MGWFSRRPKNHQELFYYARQFFLVNLLWHAFWIGLLAGFAFLTEGVEASGPVDEESFTKEIASGEFALSTYPILLFLAFLEEVIFRFFPLTFALAIMTLFKLPKTLVLVVAIISAGVFGWVHLDNHPADVQQLYSTKLSVLVFQGFSGAIFAAAFLKYCGMHAKYVVGAVLFTTALHFTWNAVLVTPLVVLALIGASM